MTVHGAKGLQAPVVILPDTMQLPRRTNRLLWDDSDDVVLWAPRAADRNGVVTAMHAAARAAQAEEHHRLLYVAMTRAEDRLYVCGWQGSREPPADCWYHLVRDAVADVARPVDDAVLADCGFEILPTVLRLDAEQVGPVAPPAPAADPVPAPLPDWVARTPAREATTPQPLAPSQLGGDEPPARSPVTEAGDDRFLRGTLVHRLLELLPPLPVDARSAACRCYLARPVHALGQAAQADIAEAVLRVLGDAEFEPLFGPASLAEVPLAGILDAPGDAAEQVISGQIDRLVVGPERIMVVDYKTHRVPPHAPDEVAPLYLSQMAAYRALLGRIYPDRPIDCYLLWTDGPDLMALPAALLDRYSPRSVLTDRYSPVENILN